MSKRIIVNGDDYGYTPEKCAGIVAAHRDGILTSTTVMINMVADGQIRDLLPWRSTLGIGLHLNFTKGRPVAPPGEIPTLVDADGEMRRPADWTVAAWDAFSRRKNPAEVEREFRAQVERFIAVIGAPPSHVDSHHFAASHPAILPVYMKIARSFGLPARLPARFRSENVFEVEAEDAEAARRKVRTTDALSSAFYCRMEDPRRAFLDALVNLAGGVTEFMFHPATVNPGDRNAIQGKIDLNLLTDPEVKDTIRRDNILLINFHDLKKEDRI